MIHSIAFLDLEHCGLIGTSGKSWRRESPDLSTAEAPEFVPRSVKYYARMTRETRCALAAASILLNDRPAGEIGLLAARSAGTLKANEDYFRDYVENGRTLGRGNLFIYTLHTSALSEIAIALGLTGPTLFMQSPENPLKSMLATADRMLKQNETDNIVAVWSDPTAAVCFLVTPDERMGYGFESDLPPCELARAIRDKVETK